jgi:hypothetical protein
MKGKEIFSRVAGSSVVRGIFKGKIFWLGFR